jgi:hypothetical protein
MRENGDYKGAGMLPLDATHEWWHSPAPVVLWYGLLQASKDAGFRSKSDDEAGCPSCCQRSYGHGFSNKLSTYLKIGNFDANVTCGIMDQKK